jgi:signal transduction histidine kinase
MGALAADASMTATEAAQRVSQTGQVPQGRIGMPAYIPALTGFDDTTFAEPAPAPSGRPSWTVGRLLTLGFVVAVVTLLIVSISAYVRIGALIRDQAAATQAAQVQTRIDATLSAIKDAETGQRGYLITGDDAYLAPYLDSLQAIKGDIKALDRSITDPRERAILGQLVTPLNSKLRELAQTIKLRRHTGFAAAQAVVQSNRGAKDMTRIRTLLNQMMRRQNGLLQQRLAASTASGEDTQRTILWGSLLGAMLVGLTATLVTGRILQPVRRITATANRMATGDFSAAAPRGGPRELAGMANAVNAALRVVTRMNGALRESEKRGLRLNDELEHRVQSRTMELESSNRELDAFAYSIAHDLRAPLRSLHGYSELIQEHCADQFDEASHDYFRRIQANTTQMAQLIDDLLRLSRTTRVELSPGPIDLSRMASEILAELQADAPGRSLETRVEPGLTSLADAHLVRLLLYQLLANSWKFTTPRSSAQIEFGELDLNGRQTFYIRDNGLGFDPQYADKLFTPFQRLHDTTDFAGSGIGLAIAERIAHRHGGRIWAESAPDQGATFFFTLTVPTTP